MYSRFTSMLVVSVALIVCVGRASAQEFVGYEGKNAVSEGDGGAKKTVDGIDFWSDGAPPYKFKLLGYITDRRHKSGLWGKISMSNLEPDVAKVAKENGGDGVILMDANAETIGAVGTGFSNTNGSATASGNTGSWHSNTSGVGMAGAVQKQNTKYAVVKYLKDVPANPTPVPPVSPPAADATPVEPAKQ